jgi:hypothetical protein
MNCSITTVRACVFTAALILVAGRSAVLVQADEATAPANQAGTKYLLAYKFSPNDPLHYRVVQDNEMTVVYNQARQVDRHHSETLRNLRIVSVDAAGVAEVEIVIDHVYLKAQRGENAGDEFDSRDPDTRAAQYDKYKAIYDSIGQPQARLTLSPSGKVLKFTPFGSFKTAGSDTEPVKSILNQFPEQPVAIGEKWSEEYDVDVTVEKGLKQKVTMIRKFRLVSVEQNVAKIELKTGVVTPLNDPSMLAQLIQRELTGTIEFDLQRGAILSRKHTVDKTVVNAFGESSSLRAVSSYEEKLRPSRIAATSSPKN